MNEIRREIEGIRYRIAVSVDALAFKVNVPARLADVIGDAASTFATRLSRRLPGSRPVGGADTAVDPGPG